MSVRYSSTISNWASETSPYVYSAFRLAFKANRKNSAFSKVSPEVWVDVIFPYFLVEDLVRFRQINKSFYLLTHEPVIWKRYLERMRIPVAQFRPTMQYRSYTDDLEWNYEIQSYVTSACALDRTWRKARPRIWREDIQSSQFRVIDLKLVPGGKFLIASVRDRRNFRFFILVYALDVLFGTRMIARVPTGYKAFNLQAKYMKHDDIDGIMIAFTRRRFKQGVPLNPRENINNFFHRSPVDTDYPVVYEACCLHMRLDSVERLVGKNVWPDKLGAYCGVAREMELPFKDIYNHKAECEIHSMTLFHVDGEACLSFVEERANGSVIKVIPLAEGTTGALICSDYVPGSPHKIRAIRYLPSQKGFLVVRTVRLTPESNEFILFEIYDLPPFNTTVQADAVTRWDSEDQWQITGEFVISDAETEKTSELHPNLMREEKCPPTIWIFAPCENPKGCLFWWFRPALGRSGQFRYQDFGGGIHQNDLYYETAYPGVERTLWLEFDKGLGQSKTLNRIRRFGWPAHRFKAQYLVPDDDPITKRPDFKNLALANIIDSDHLRGAVNSAGGLIAMAWDENSGKICLAAEKEERIRIMDMSAIPVFYKTLAFKWTSKLYRS